MSLTSILKDFAVRAGLIVEGTNNVTSSTGMTGTLQVNGGAAIAKDTYIGGSVHVGSSSTVYQNSYVLGDTFLKGVTATGNVSITSSTQATTTTAALAVTGGVLVGNNLVVNSLLASTTTVANNALFVQGGVGIDGGLLVDGPVYFKDSVVFSGTSTYVYSTNTVYTDNLINLHVPVGSTGTDHNWTVDDGQDIGLVFHYYKGSTDKNAFLGLDNATGNLEWFANGAEVGNVYTGSEFGTFKTGGIRLTDATSATTTATGALQVQGGIGAGNIYLSGNSNAESVNARNLTPGRVVFVGANGQLSDDSDLTYDPLTNLLTANISSSNTATDLAGGATGSIPYQLNPGDTTFLPIGQAGFVLVSNGSTPTWNTTGTVVSGEATTATNLKFGVQYQIPYQTAPGATAFEDNFKYRYDTDTLVTVNAQFTGTTNSVGPASGAVQLSGGMYVAQDIYLGGTMAVLGGSIKSVTSSFDLLPTTATTVNFATSATTLNVGWINGATTIRNVTTISTGTDATSTADGALIVTGGVGIGKKLFVGGNTDINGNVAATGSFTSTRANNTADGSGQIYLNGATGNRIDFNNQGTAAPAFTTRSVGTKLVLYPALSGASTDYAVGVDSGTFWSSVPGNDAGQFFKWYGGATEVASLSGTGALILTGAARFDGNISVNGGDITSIATTFNLINTTATTVNFAGAATALTIGATTGFTEIRNATTVTSTTAASSTNTGALQVVGGVGVGGALYVGGNTVFTGDIAVNGGDVTTDQATFNLVNTNATTVNIAGAGTAVTISATTGYTQIRNATTVTNTTNATSTNTGALQVQGGVGVANSVWIGNALRVIGATTLNNLSSAVTTATQLTVTGSATVSGIVYANDISNANAVNSGAIQTLGGIGVTKDVYAGGAITAGATQAATTGTVVNGFYTNNTLIASFTSNVITGTAQVNLDFWSSSNYRSARYFVQITDGSNIHVSEISLFHDGVKAYINEYGIATNNGQLGSFDATLGAGNVTVKFTPTSATAMTIKMVRTTISA
jgi:hypothetical protein